MKNLAAHFVLISLLVAHAVHAQRGTVYEPGLDLRIYSVGADLQIIPELVRGQTPNFNVLAASLDLKDADFGGLEDHFLTIATARLHVPRAGSYRFRLISDDGSALFLDGKKVLDFDGLHGPSALETGIDLEKRIYRLEVRHFENGGGARLALEWRQPGRGEFELISKTWLSTPKGVVRVTSPGKKKVRSQVYGRAPGDGRPLLHVHPGYDLTTIRPEGFEPKVGGLDFLSDGRMVICCWDPEGSVWILDHVDGDDRKKITKKRIAAGLAEPLGLKVVGDRLFVLQKQELTELIDKDGDDVIDEYRCVSDDWTVSSNFHEFAFGLVEKDGWMYFNLAIAINPGGASTRPQVENRGRSARVNIETGAFEFLTRGLRTPNGIGPGPDGEIFITDNQGDWLPSSKVLHLRKGAFYNQRAALPAGWKEQPVQPPVVWMPQGEIGNSPSEPALFTQGPFAGQLAVAEVTHGGIKRVFMEKVKGNYQGALFRFTQGLEAGINRMKIRDDGTIYVGGIGSNGNWGQTGKLKYGLQKLTPNGERFFEIRRMSARSNGFEVELTDALQASMGWTAEDYEAKFWRYVPTSQYGGPKIDATAAKIKRVSMKDRRTLLIEVDEMRAGHVFYLRLPSRFRSESYRALWSNEAWYTLNAIPDEPLSAPFEYGIPPTRHNALATHEVELGWKLLFDGKSAEAWRGFKKKDFPDRGWSVEDGLLKVAPKGRGGDIITREQYGDFELQLEWRVAERANSGIMYRVTEEARTTYMTGPEMQILDDERHPDGDSPLTSAGALYGLYAVRRPAVRPAGEWNHVHVRLRGGHVEHWLNGTKVVDCDMSSDDYRERLSKSKFRKWKLFGLAKRGHLAIQDHGDEVWFRNLKIRPL